MLKIVEAEAAAERAQAEAQKEAARAEAVTTVIITRLIRVGMGRGSAEKANSNDTRGTAVDVEV